MIAWALNQTVGWAQATGQLDPNAEPIREDRGDIPARIVRRPQTLRRHDGLEIRSGTQCHTLAPIGAHDRLRIGGAWHDPIAIREGLGLYEGRAAFYITYL